MNKKEKDEKLAAHLPGVLHYHQTMLGDGVRNRLLYKAIKRHVSTETSFLDIGAGTGVWAILAAKLGAKRVVAVEAEECLIPIIHKHAVENGVAPKIEIIHGKSDDVKIRGKFDVIVSELFGSAAFGKETVNSFIDIRDRFLAGNGVLIPEKLSLNAVPAHLERSIHEIPAALPFSSGFFRTLKLNYNWNLSFAEHDRVKFLAEPMTLFELDFHSISDARPLNSLTASWRLKNLKAANAIVTFNKSTFADGIELDGFSSQSWASSCYEFAPSDRRAGEITFNLSMDFDKSTWSIGLQGSNGVQKQNYAPVFAFARVKMEQKATPHKKFEASKAGTDQPK